MSENQRPMTPEELVAHGLPADFHGLDAEGQKEAIAKRAEAELAKVDPAEDPGYAAHLAAVQAQQAAAAVHQPSQPSVPSGGYTRGLEDGRRQGLAEAQKRAWHDGYLQGVSEAELKQHSTINEQHLRERSLNMALQTYGHTTLPEQTVAIADAFTRYIANGELPEESEADYRFSQGAPLDDGETPGERRHRDADSDWFWSGGSVGWVVTAKVKEGEKRSQALDELAAQDAGLLADQPDQREPANGWMAP